MKYIKFTWLICFLLMASRSFAQYQAGDTIQIAAIDYITDTIEAEWNATNVTSVPGKNVPTELDGRIVIGNTKSGSILGYPVFVGAAGGSFIMTIDYKGVTGYSAEGYMNLWVDGGAKDKIWMRTEGWTTSTSNSFQLTPGFHTIYTEYKGSSGSFFIDKFLLNALPGSLQAEPVRQISALTYAPETLEVETYNSKLSSITSGKCTIEGDNPTYVTDVQDKDTLVFPVRVGAGGGMFDFTYHYKKLTGNAASIQLCLGDSMLESIDLSNAISTEWETVTSVAPIVLAPSYHEIKIVINGTDAHIADYFVLAPVENSLLNEHPIIFVNADEKSQLLDKIADNQWAESIVTQLKNNVASAVFSHETNPETILSSIPEFGVYETHNDLPLGLDAAIIYFLTSEESYAQFSADILAYYCKKLANKTPQTSDVLADHFMDARQIYPFIALIYDFIYGYVKSPYTTFYDIDTKTRNSFDDDAIQKMMKNIAGNVLQEYGDSDTHGRVITNHHVLTAPGALFPILCVSDDVERERLFKVFWETGTKQQASFTKTILPMYTSQGIWPESLSYSFMVDVPKILNIVDRLKPELNAVKNNRHLLEGSFIYPNLKDPTYTYIRFGDSKRYNENSDEYYRYIMNMSERNGYDDLKQKAEVTLKQFYNSVGGYNPIIPTDQYAHSKSLELFWGISIPDSVSGIVDFKPTVLVEHAGVALQRNYVEENNELYGLNGYIGGAHYVHSHCTGIAMELYGAGYVMAPNAGLSPSVAGRSEPEHTDYFRLYAGNNTVIVNGTSHGLQTGAWKSESNVWQNTTVNIASEPKHMEDPISSDFSFATQFLKDEVNNCDQQRTLSVIRTSATTAYYFDMFRSKSLTKNNFHDYIYHNLGDKTTISNAEGIAYPLTSTSKYDNDINDIVHSPGWRFFEDEKTTASTNDELKIRFDIEYDNKYMHLSIPGGIDREYTKALAPPTREAKNDYVSKKTQVIAIRQNGEAWNRPYITILEPSDKERSSVQSTEQLVSGNMVVGAKVVSKAGSTLVTDYVISLPSPGIVEVEAYGITFNGRFAVVRTVAVSDTHEDVMLYIGEGTELKYGTSTLEAQENKGLQTFSNVEKVEPVATYTFNVSSNVTEGAVSQSLEQLVYIEGTELELTATAEEGYAFTGWSGSVSSSENPLSITVDSSMTLVANFEEVTALNTLSRLDVNISPNPSDGVFTIKADNGDESTYELYDSKGLKVQTGQFVGRKVLTIDGEGIYFMKVSSSKGSALRKLIVI